MPIDPVLGGISVGLSALGMVSSFLGSQKAEKDAKRQAMDQGLVEARTTEEKIYQLGMDRREMFGETMARYTGSGVRVATPTLDGSTVMTPATPTEPTPPNINERWKHGRGTDIQNYIKRVENMQLPSTAGTTIGGGTVGKILSEQGNAINREMRLTQELGASNVQQTLMGGKNLADQYRYAGYANVASSLSDIFTTLASFKT